MNSEGISLGKELQNFKDFVSDFPPELKGAALAESESIRNAHNAFARPEPFVPDEQR